LVLTVDRSGFQKRQNDWEPSFEQAEQPVDSKLVYPDHLEVKVNGHRLVTYFMAK